MTIRARGGISGTHMPQISTTQLSGDPARTGRFRRPAIKVSPAHLSKRPVNRRSIGHRNRPQCPRAARARTQPGLASGQASLRSPYHGVSLPATISAGQIGRAPKAMRRLHARVGADCLATGIASDPHGARNSLAGSSLIKRLRQLRRHGVFAREQSAPVLISAGRRLGCRSGK
jgi:hypothetical protein